MEGNMKKTKKVKILPNENKKSENESFIPQTMTGTKPEDKQWFEKESFWQNFGPIMFDSQLKTNNLNRKNI